MGLRIWQVDAFTHKPFTGNPAAVCVLDTPADDAWMQAVAAEMNLSETAFLSPESDGYRLRWFTPAVEVDLCGHATLASAHIIWEQGFSDAGTLKFFTKSGELRAAKKDANWIQLDFPEKILEPSPAPDGLLESLGVTASFIGKNQFDYLVEVDNEDLVRTLTPDISGLTAVKTRGVIVTSRSSSFDADFISRFFAPAVGVPEDPVTGSAHCALGPYWAEKLGQEELVAYQASRRGGFLKIQVKKPRVYLAGQAVTVMKGELL